MHQLFHVEIEYIFDVVAAFFVRFRFERNSLLRIKAVLSFQLTMKSLFCCCTAHVLECIQPRTNAQNNGEFMMFSMFVPKQIILGEFIPACCSRLAEGRRTLSPIRVMRFGKCVNK